MVMALKINEVVIQAKMESDNYQSADTGSKEIINIPDSVKKEIIDECLEKLKEYIDRQVRDDRR
jgi:hypothetical protein